jgi:hypothetical protein
MVLAYPGSLQNSTQLDRCADCCPFIWSRLSGPIRFRCGLDKGTKTNQPSCPGLLVTRAGFTVMALRQSNDHTNGKVQTHRDRKRRDRLRAKSRECSAFFDIKGIVDKEFVLGGQTVNSAYYCDVLRRMRDNVHRLRPKIWRKGTGRCITKTYLYTLPFSPGNFWPKIRWLSEITAVGIRHADDVAPSLRKSWQSLRRQAAVARSV